MISSILKEYGFLWAFNRGLYSAKLKMLSTFPSTEKIFEKKIPPVSRTDIFDIDVEAIKSFLTNLPENEKDNIIKSADKACEGVIKAFSSLELDYGKPVDWQLNPISGMRCDENEKWYRIKDFDASRGDIKAIWEISRFSHFYILARAFLLTDDEKYYLAFSKQLEDWLKKNPYSYGANFKCGQECALRMVNGLFAFTVFSKKNMTTANDERNIKLLIECSYRKIRSNFFYAYRCIRNNHTISELLGIIIGSWCCNDEKQLDKAYRILDKVVCEQFVDDGGYTQHSFNYQRLALQILECVISISAKTEHSICSESKKRILKSAELLYQCQTESGDVPNYGPNDGALVFPLSCCDYRDFRPVVSTVFRLLTNHRIYEPGLYDEEFLWFSKPCVQTTDNLVKNSSAFTKAGLFTLRNSRTFAMMIANDFHSRPAHMDQLHLDLWIDGVNVFCDTGTFSYADTLGRDLANTSGHNTAVFPNVDQMNKHGAFMVYNWTERKTFASNEHMLSAEIVSKNGYRHYRELAETSNGFSLTDRIESSKQENVELFFHTPCEVLVENEIVYLIKNGYKVCSIQSSIIPKVESGYRSLYYLQKEKCNTLIYTGNRCGETTLCKLNISYIEKKSE